MPPLTIYAEVVIEFMETKTKAKSKKRKKRARK